MNLGALISESRNPATMDLDQISTLAMMQRFNDEDKQVPAAISRILPQIAEAVDLAAKALKQGGRLIYIGAGTSGRLGVLDAAECPPTFGVGFDKVIGLIAGGESAMFKAVEGAEDSELLGQQDLQAVALTAADMVVGLAASGRTPYVIGALRYARQLGCATAAISCNPNSLIAQQVQVAILPLVGAEALTGSTRLKAGTAQKLVLNMISTGVMVRLGKVYENLMVDVKASNEKLVDRACRIVVAATDVNKARAAEVLILADFEVKTAILMILNQCGVVEARERLAATAGYLRAALIK